MKPIAFVALLFSFSTHASEECLLSGTFKVDVERTMASYLLNNEIDSEEERQAKLKGFSWTKHEWRCKEFRFWVDVTLVMDWKEFSLLEEQQNSYKVTFRDRPDVYFDFSIDGNCYKTWNSHRKYHEFLCPAEE